MDANLVTLFRARGVLIQYRRRSVYQIGVFNAAISLCMAVCAVFVLAVPAAAKQLDPSYEAATTRFWVSFCEGRPADQRSYCWRNCTSYVAYRLETAGVTASDYQSLGHAYQWAESAAARGIKVGLEPKAGAVAYWTDGIYGHVAWVEKVNGDGTVATSNYDGFTESFYAEDSVRPEGYIYFSNVQFDPPKPKPQPVTAIFEPLKEVKSPLSKMLTLKY
ncbi:MAG: hypothetical protein JWL85_271 [Candidatus Saccharibacteria bacterium]|nr:hypothetical protein [Candidatus Saccharibacteria bacterium]